MKNIITKALLVGTVLVAAVGCGYNPDEENKLLLQNASDMVFQMNKDNEITAADYKLANSLTLVTGDYNLEWAITMIDEVEDLVSITRKETGTFVFIKTATMVQLQEPAEYELKYTISDAYGNSLERKMLRTVPNPSSCTVAEFHKKPVSDTDFYKMEGIVTTVNKKSSSGSFTLTDSTGTVFSYSGAKVKLGSKVSLVGTRDANYDLPQLTNVTILSEETTNEYSKVMNYDKLTTATYADFVQMTVDYADADKKLDLIADTAIKFFKITDGYLVRTDDGYYGLHGEPGTKECESGGETWLGLPKGDKKINLYYHSNDELKAMVNQKVDLYGVVRGMSQSTITVQIYKTVAPGTTITFE